jgi:hypothetical protein
MNPAAYALLVDDLPQEGAEHLAVGGAQPSHQFLFVLGGDPAAPGELPAAGGGQEEAADPAVAGVGPALDELRLFELVDATIRLGGAPIASAIACWEQPSEVSIAFITRNCGGCSPTSAIRPAKRCEARIPTCERRNATDDGARSPSSGVLPM